MRSFLSPVMAGVLVLGLGGGARAQDPDPRSLIDRAIKAQGGLEMLGRSVASHRKSKGAFLTDGFTFTGEVFSEPGNRRRIALQGTVKGQPATRVLVLDGKKGWITYDGTTIDLDADFVERLEKSIYADRVCGLVTLVKDKGYTLTGLGESQVRGKPARGVRVACAGKPDVLLYFDKESGLLVKSSNRVTDPNLNREVNQEVYYFDYRELGAGPPAGQAAYAARLCAREVVTSVTSLAAAEQAVRAARLGTDGPALLAFLRKRIPAEGELVKLKDLVIKLGHRSFSVRQKATAELKRMGLKAVPLLRQAARDGDGEVARRAGQCLQELAGGPDQALTAAVARLIAFRRPAGAAEVLLDYLPWAPNEAVARAVQGALAEIADAGGKQDPALVRALKDGDPQRRAAAAAALGQGGGASHKLGWRRVFLEGVRVSTRSQLYRDGEHFMDLESTEAQFYNRLDDSLFTRP
jgi:hypothetical protein